MARRKPTPSPRVYLTLSERQHDLLQAFAAELAKPPATLATRFLAEVLEGGLDSDGRPSRAQVEATIRALHGEAPPAANVPRWHQPLSVILAERAWWATWYPRLCQLLSRDTEPRRPSALGAGDADPVLDSAGYFDLLTFLFRPIPQPRGEITWRSLDYPAAAEAQAGGEQSRPLRPAWEAVIRHTAVAMTALETATEPSLLIAVEDQIRHGWLSTLLSLAGEAPPGREALPRLPKRRLV